VTSATLSLGVAGVMMVQLLVWGSVWREETTDHLTKLEMFQLTSVHETDGTL